MKEIKTLSFLKAYTTLTLQIKRFSWTFELSVLSFARSVLCYILHICEVVCCFYLFSFHNSFTVPQCLLYSPHIKVNMFV